MREGHTQNPIGQLLILTAGISKLEQTQAIEARAVGVISKTLEPAEITAAIRRVAARQAIQPVGEIVDLLRYAAAERERARQVELGLAQ